MADLSHSTTGPNGAPAGLKPDGTVMRLFRHYTDLPADARGPVAALGNFDGVHLGHAALISEAAAIARAAGRPLAVITFEPHPRSLFRPGDPPFRLTPFRVKTRELAALGVDLCFTLHFDQTLSLMTAEQFVQAVLVNGLGVHHTVFGYDFAFGHNRTGTPDALAALATRYGFGVTAVPPVHDAAGEIFSSTRVRRHLLLGEPRQAAAVLGRPWEVEGRVEHGAQLGRTIGFPTANLDLADYQRPAYGVYAIRALPEHGQWLGGVANLGKRPTVDGLREWFEIHLFDFSGDLYGRHLRVQLIDYLRPEVKFADFDALKAQIRLDAEAARQALQPAGSGPPGPDQPDGA